MKNLKKVIALTMVAVLSVGVMAGCGKKTETAKTGESDLAYVQTSKKMVIGYTDYAPMNYKDDKGEFVGFDTDFAKAVCEKLGVTPEFVEINWDTKEIELKDKKIDCIWNGFTITEERKANIEFTKPYIKNKQVVVIKVADKDKYKDIKSLSDKKLVAEVSSAGESTIKEDETLKSANYVPVQKQTDALLEVKSGTADAAVLDFTLASAMVGEKTDYSDLMIVPNLDLCVEEYGIGFRKNSDIAAKVNGIIDELTADGTMEKIAKKYDLSAILVK